MQPTGSSCSQFEQPTCNLTFSMKKFHAEKVRKTPRNHKISRCFPRTCGGDKRDRTADLLTARHDVTIPLSLVPQGFAASPLKNVQPSCNQQYT
nr:MAG TPA: hypothetical protein [Caudoviricetes sp.]